MSQQQATEQQQNNSLFSRRGINELFFTNDPSSATTFIDNAAKNKQFDTQPTQEYNLFPNDLGKLGGSLPKASNFAQLAKLAENPFLFGSSSENNVYGNDKSIEKPVGYGINKPSPIAPPSQSGSNQPLSQSPQLQQQQPKKREVSMYYLSEISHFSNDDINAAVQTKVDNSTGEIYGPVQEFKVSTTFVSRNEFIPQLHRESKEVAPAKPGSAIASVLLSSNGHDDRGNVVLFCGENVSIDGQMNEPPLLGINLSLACNSKYKIPIRLIRSFDNGSFRYDGLYFVGDYFYERNNDSTSLWHYVFKFVRIFGQPSLPSNEPTTMQPPNLVPQTPQPPSTTPQPMVNDVGGGQQPMQQSMQRQQPYQQHMQQQQPYQPQYMPSQQQSMHHQQYAPQQQSYHQPQQQHQYYQQQQQQQHYNPYPTHNMYNNNNTPMPMNNLPPMYQQGYNNQNNMRNRPMFSPVPKPTQQPSSSSGGMDLNHSRIREMLSQLRRKNNTFTQRITQYDSNIDAISDKVETESANNVNNEMVTSRNKGFTWNLDDEKLEQPKKRPNGKKRKSEDIANDGGDEGNSPLQMQKNKKSRKTKSSGPPAHAPPQHPPQQHARTYDKSPEETSTDATTVATTNEPSPQEH